MAVLQYKKYAHFVLVGLEWSDWRSCNSESMLLCPNRFEEGDSILKTAYSLAILIGLNCTLELQAFPGGEQEVDVVLEGRWRHWGEMTD